MCGDKCDIFSNIFEYKTFCLRYRTIFEEIHFWTLTATWISIHLMSRKEKKHNKKNVSERVKRSIWSWWNNFTLEMIVWKGKRMWVKCYCVHTFLSAEGISLTGSHVLGFFHVHDFIFIQCIYILNLKIHYCMASCRFDYLFVWIFFFGQYCSEFKLHVLWFVEICLFYKLKLWEKKFLPVNFD